MVAQLTSFVLVPSFLYLNGEFEYRRVNAKQGLIEVVITSDILVSVVDVDQRVVGKSFGEVSRGSENGVPTVESVLDNLYLVSVFIVNNPGPGKGMQYTHSKGDDHPSSGCFACGIERDSFRDDIAGLQGCIQDSLGAIAQVDIISILSTDLQTTLLPLFILGRRVIDHLIDGRSSRDTL